MMLISLCVSYLPMSAKLELSLLQNIFPLHFAPHQNIAFFHASFLGGALIFRP